MLVVRHNGREIASITGSHDVLYRDRSFEAPFIRPMQPTRITRTLAPEDAARQERGEYLCEESSPLMVELRSIGLHNAAEIVRSLPPVGSVTIRDEGKY